MKNLGIKDIGVYFPDSVISNFEQAKRFDVNENFLKRRIGVESVTRAAKDEYASDMAVQAVLDLKEKCDLELDKIECLFVVTQNPDYSLPHTSAIVHGKLGLDESCACLDISLGCSGFVYGLSVIESFMVSNNLQCGVLVTADPYSKVIADDDKNTSLLFGDAATATLIGPKPVYTSGRFTFGTAGAQYENLICKNNEIDMNGRGIFEFAATYVPIDIHDLLELNEISIDKIDKFYFHQASRFMVETIAKRMKLPQEKWSFSARDYGNTVSSTIPILLEKEIGNREIRTAVICGFGVGLSWSSGILFRS